MNIAAVLALIVKAVTVVTAIVQAGEDAAPALQSLYNLVTGAQKGTVTQADLDTTEATLDGLIADFNLDMPA